MAEAATETMTKMAVESAQEQQKNALKKVENAQEMAEVQSVYKTTNAMTAQAVAEFVANVQEDRIFNSYLFKH